MFDLCDKVVLDPYPETNAEHEYENANENIKMIRPKGNKLSEGKKTNVEDKHNLQLWNSRRKYEGKVATIVKEDDTGTERSLMPSFVATASNNIDDKYLCASRPNVDHENKPTVKKSISTNVVLVGKTTDKIRRGEVGKTTFGALDLHLPHNMLSKKSKKP
jgi:hypothetical protein